MAPPMYPPQHFVTQNYFRGMRAMESGSLDDARAILLAEPSTSPCYGLARGNAALCLLRLQRFGEAEAELRATLGLLPLPTPDHPPSWVQFARNLGEALVGQGRCAEALAVFNSAGLLANELVEQHPEYAPDIELEKGHAFNSWASAHLHLKQLPVAIELFRAALEIYQRHRDNAVGLAETLTNYAIALTQEGRSVDADLALQEAEQLAAGRGDSDQVNRHSSRSKARRPTKRRGNRRGDI
jgi:tetratricopeptide (TPR) repeat protein